MFVLNLSMKLMLLLYLHRDSLDSILLQTLRSPSPASGKMVKIFRIPDLKFGYQPYKCSIIIHWDNKQKQIFCLYFVICVTIHHVCVCRYCILFSSGSVCWQLKACFAVIVSVFGFKLLVL